MEEPGTNTGQSGRQDLERNNWEGTKMLAGQIYHKIQDGLSRLVKPGQGLCGFPVIGSDDPSKSFFAVDRPLPFGLEVHI